MNIKSLITKILSEKGEIRVADVIKATGFSRTYVNRFFQELQREGKIVLFGKANKARYVTATSANLKKIKLELKHFRRIFTNSKLSEDIVLNQIKLETGIFLNLSPETSRILDYAFTEMLNNAIEHSKSKKILVDMICADNKVKFIVDDKGVGILKNIMKKRGLKNELEAIQDLLKGKQTTSPEAHTGEGIFFTSKSADILVIKSSDKKLIFDNLAGDVFIRNLKPVKGTKVEFQIFIDSKRDLTAIFKEYSGEAFEFSTTKVLVNLYELDANFISRSQARRVVSGLDKFKKIILDFKNVETVGQAFADEVFRVWQNNHKDIKIEYQNTNDNVEFMIKRAKSA